MFIGKKTDFERGLLFMKNRFFLIALAGILMVILLCGCGIKRDELGNALITSDWKLVSLRTNGTFTDVENEQPLVKLITARDNPKFKCKDGTHCTFSMAGKTHNGTISGQDGNYEITYDDTSKPMLAEISGDRLTLKDTNGKFEIVFNAK